MNDLVMGADQFLLTWNNHRSNFAEVFTQLRVQDQLVDVTLLCDGGSYPAHRLVLAACSPYFHQLFTRLPTHHPLIYLRDVKQAELEALLEFIYRGEVSVANSELTGLIKIAESLRIKGLGDVSQQQHPGAAAGAGVGEKRAPSPISPGSPQQLHTHTHRPRKAPRLASSTCSSNDNKNIDAANYKNIDTNFASLLSPANSYGHAPTRAKDGFAQLMDPSGPDGPEHDAADAVDHTAQGNAGGWEVSMSESKLRSCLEGLDVPQALPQPVVVPRVPLTPAQTKAVVGGVGGGKREGVDGGAVRGTGGRRRQQQQQQQESQDNRRVRNAPPPLNTIVTDTHRDTKVMKENIKTEVDADSSGQTTSPATTTTTNTNNDMLVGGDRTNNTNSGSEAPALPLYDTPGELGASMGELATPLLAAGYRHMLSSLATPAEERAFSPLIPTTVQDTQQQQQPPQPPPPPPQQAPSPTNRETRSLTCQLCGATIKHIANFRRHMKQHLNPRRFPCPWCSAAFGRKDNLKTHTRKHHPGEIEAQDGSTGGGGGGVTTSSTTGGRQGEDDTRGTGLNGLGTRSGGEEEEGVAGEDSSDHNEGLVIAEDTDEEEEEYDDSPTHTDE